VTRKSKEKSAKATGVATVLSLYYYIYRKNSLFAIVV
jgi:hypothetical protein